MLRGIVSCQVTATVALGRHHWCVDQSPTFTQPRSVYRNSVPVDQWCRHQNRTSNYIGGENNGTDVAQPDFEIKFICLGFFWQWGHSIPTLDGRGRGWVGRCCVVVWGVCVDGVSQRREKKPGRYVYTKIVKLFTCTCILEQVCILFIEGVHN